jgi:hypothetical protein
LRPKKRVIQQTPLRSFRLNGKNQNLRKEKQAIKKLLSLVRSIEKESQRISLQEKGRELDQLKKLTKVFLS